MNSTLLAYAFNAEKKLVHIDSVKNGLECGCVCPGCKEPLVAKNDGKVRVHHFAHLSGNDCGTGYQTIRHIWGKELIFENQSIPAVIEGKKGVKKTNRIGMEVDLPELNIKPDIFAKAVLEFNTNFGGKIFADISFIVEIYVTHKVDENKANIIKKAGIPAVEIDLSKSTATTKEELAKDLSNKDNWNIINDKIGARFTAAAVNELYSLVNAYRNIYGTQSYNSRATTTKSYSGFYRRRRF